MFFKEFPYWLASKEEVLSAKIFVFVFKDGAKLSEYVCDSFLQMMVSALSFMQVKYRRKNDCSLLPDNQLE